MPNNKGQGDWTTVCDQWKLKPLICSTVHTMGKKELEGEDPPLKLTLNSG